VKWVVASCVSTHIARHALWPRPRPPSVFYDRGVETPVTASRTMTLPDSLFLSGFTEHVDCHPLYFRILPIALRSSQGIIKNVAAVVESSLDTLYDPPSLFQR